MGEYKSIYIPGEMFILLSKYGDPEKLMLEAINDCLKLCKTINND
jgi:hypothetical protein